VQILTNLINQFKQFWEQTTVRARTGIVATAIVCAVTIVGVGVWSSRPQYVPLVSNLSSAETAELVSKLDAARIPNKFDFWATTVLVPKSQLGEARMAAGNLVGESWETGAESPGPGPWITPEMERLLELRRLETSIAETLSRLNGVTNATVHLGQADRSPFMRNQRSTTASVVLELSRGTTFTREQAATIVDLVAYSVDGLERDGVTVSDTSGHTLSFVASPADSAMARQREYRRQVETDLVSKAEWMLAEMLGSGRAIVRVTADIDFTETIRTATTYDPDSKVKLREKILSTTKSDTQSSPSGPAGTAANVGTTASGNQAKPYSEKTENIETDYQNAVTEDKVTEAAGEIRRLTVAAMVDLSAADDGDPASASAVTKEQVEAILKQAVGFDDSRKDQIEVLVTKLAGVDLVGPVAAPGYLGWESINQLLRNVSLGLASIVALILGLLIVRRMRPVVDPSAASRVVSVERARQIAELSERALADPEALSRFIHVWLNEAKQEGGEEQESEQAERDSEQKLGNDVPPASGKRDAMAA